MQPPKFPNLFLVGSGKCGTTTLYDCLKQHPDVFMCSPKEPAYFCKDFHEESDEFHKKKKFFSFRDKQDYLSLFSSAKTQSVRGEASTLYFLSQVAAKNIYEFNPEAKIIITIRNPVDLLYSVHGEYVLRFRENINDFAEALAAEKQRRNGENVPKTIPAPSLLFYSDKVKFSSHIQRYLDFFDKEQVKVIVYEDFKENNYKVIQDLFKFIGVNPNIDIDLKTYRASRKIKSKLIKNILASPYISQFPKKIIKGKNYYKLRSLFYKEIAEEMSRPQLQPKLKKEIMEKCREEVEKTERLIQRNLSEIWGYKSTVD
ncbi:MAG: sulfotransferase domain-containing protein [Acidobacteriota bacterium]